MARCIATLIALLALVGCKAVSALSTQEVVVHFVPNSSAAEHLRVLQTCGVVPHASPEPIPAHETAGQAQTDVRFLVNPASGSNLNRLYVCLNRFPDVVIGYDTPGM
jgi:hypothetical protein